MFEYRGNKHWAGKEELSERLWDIFHYILLMSCAAIIFGCSSDPLYVLGLCIILTLLFIRSRIQKKANGNHTDCSGNRKTEAEEGNPVRSIAWR